MNNFSSEKNQWKNKNSSKIMIRKAVKEDSKVLIEYINKVGGESDFLTFGLGEYTRTVEEEESFIEDTLKKDNAYFIVAEDNEKIVGNLNFAGGLRERNAHVGEFGVSVLKEYWGQGIGEKLINSLIKWSKESNIIRKINLKVREDNYGAIKLYKKLGFIKEGILTREFRVNGEFFDAILMGLNID
ncbi:GNAT family N-acetyltransferase [Clostridium botulinum]|uniref:GNAT family N-acetyltransferase n=1 Tax=Clostridium botulinum TaxID=1491 RepID=UPI000653020E|nr:GNAT family N-acetyltransferase [Clostridium botulinum]MCD3351729.1 GNAT family N-acetyltransferase [Clostridium botulinum D/C]MCD3360675.1 GNAT family N-acetyltransferase [Clostridium botulinum D/C]MCD3363764.1 GNAT family N-acetyltransferase [Clostridium botulinum D/C]MCD3366432.1 GNAT family N-acetyltransferase [Clostridium botulinum D/C]QPW61354.1 GNAT family N-acetyltransferase [Clostridium botulinum]